MINIAKYILPTNNIVYNLDGEEIGTTVDFLWLDSYFESDFFRPSYINKESTDYVSRSIGGQGLFREGAHDNAGQFYFKAQVGRIAPVMRLKLDEVLKNPDELNINKSTQTLFLGEFPQKKYKRNYRYYEGSTYFPYRIRKDIHYIQSQQISLHERKTDKYMVDRHIVQPIEWEIRNWQELPKEINPKGTGTAKFIEIQTKKFILGYDENYYSSFEKETYEYTDWNEFCVREYFNNFGTVGFLATAFFLKENDFEHLKIEAKKVQEEAELYGVKKTKGKIQSKDGRMLTLVRENPKQYANKYINLQERKEKFNKMNQIIDGSKRTIQNEFGVSVDPDQMSIDEQMKFYIEHGDSFMLHGKSGVGKSRRVAEIDPNYVSITLSNGMLPEEVVGKVVYPNNDTTKAGKWVAPAWYVDICNKCKTEPNKKHVLFIDEITNVKAAEQSLVYDVVLNRSVIPGKGKLPENVVVVAAGNEMVDSSAANNMPEPLFRRFSGHINIPLDIEEWLEWGSQRKDENSKQLKIHPMVREFVEKEGYPVFYSNYDEFEPPKHAIDPRGWEQISNIIYASEGRELLGSLIQNKLGPEIGGKFLRHAKTYYSSVSNEQKTETILNNLNASIEELAGVRKFIFDKYGKDAQLEFDVAWVGDSKEKAVQLHELKSMIELGVVDENEQQFKLDTKKLKIKSVSSVDDQIAEYINHGVPFMLHGPSGVGKSRRIAEIDPDYVSITLSNGMLPEEVTGKTIYPTGKIEEGGIWKAPAWYDDICKKSKAEPNKKHILFIDELTNVRGVEQSLVYSIILDRSVSPNQGKLPENVVVVAAGNSPEESAAAYNMAEPLFRRFVGHVYIKPDVNEWIKWGSQPKTDNPEQTKVHKVIREFVKENSQFLYTPYDPENPKGFAIDPRGWEQVSEILYRNDEKFSYDLFVNKIGKELTEKLDLFMKKYNNKNKKQLS